MYRKGEGAGKSAARAFMWFSLAAKRGDRKAKADMRDREDDDACGDVASAGHGAGLRGLELPKLRVLIK